MVESKQLEFDGIPGGSQVEIKLSSGWRHSDLIYVEQGIGYGTTDTGTTIPLGDVANFETFLRNGINQGELRPVQIAVLNEIKRLEDDIGRSERVNEINTKLRTPGTKQRNNQRVRLGDNARNNSKHFKPVKVTSKLSLHPVRQEQSMLFSKSCTGMA